MQSSEQEQRYENGRWLMEIERGVCIPNQREVTKVTPNRGFESSSSADALEAARQLHIQNQERMRAIEDSINNLRESISGRGETLVRIEENTRCLPSIADRVDSLERSRDRAHGVMAAIGFLWAGVEVLIHYFWKK
jgi:hypothetical protein